MKRIRHIVGGITALLFCTSESAFADCAETTLESVADCIEGEGSITGSFSFCISTFNDGGSVCSTGQILEKFAADHFVDTIEEECCNKSTAQRIRRCFTNERREHTRPATVRKVINSTVRDRIKDEIDEELEAVDQLGTCTSEEDEDS